MFFYFIHLLTSLYNSCMFFQMWYNSNFVESNGHMVILGKKTNRNGRIEVSLVLYSMDLIRVILVTYCL